MEHTKGKLEILGGAFKPSKEDPRVLMGIKGEHILFHTVQKNDKANAAELVRRWNAFEGLLEACLQAKGRLKQCQEVLSKYSDKYSAHKTANFLAYSKLEAAIAAAKG